MSPNWHDCGVASALGDTWLESPYARVRKGVGVEPRVDSLSVPNARGPLSSWVLDRLVGIERPLPTRHGFGGLDDDAQLVLYLCYEPTSREDVQRRDLLPRTGVIRAGVITHRRRLRPHVALSVAGTHTDPRRPCVEVEAGGRQRRGQLRAEPLSGCLVVAQRLPGRRTRKPAAARARTGPGDWRGTPGPAAAGPAARLHRGPGSSCGRRATQAGEKRKLTTAVRPPVRGRPWER